MPDVLSSLISIKKEVPLTYYAGSRSTNQHTGGQKTHFRFWHETVLRRCPQDGRYRGKSGRRADSPFRPRITPSRHGACLIRSRRRRVAGTTPCGNHHDASDLATAPIPRGLHLRQCVLAGVAIADSEGSVGKVFAAAHRVKLTAALDSLPLAGARQEGPDARLIRTAWNSPMNISPVGSVQRHEPVLLSFPCVMRP
jgi:hypothetical protein